MASRSRGCGAYKRDRSWDRSNIYKNTRLLGNVALMTDAYGKLSLQSEWPSIVARTNSTTEVAFRVLRGKALAGRVKLD